ncbi:hypothetical protein [Hahella sp. HN01]|uniref:hypothetical protein n=1 Tax=Hahella sp. HN01 TaxID=2847262 RepID=UPI001C1ED664|nr:hypothetical protein [Hahella sp. HN01]MBU6954566.1 hypothetical protein [Hahella sp. HN01]
MTAAAAVLSIAFFIVCALILAALVLHLYWKDTPCQRRVDHDLIDGVYYITDVYRIPLPGGLDLTVRWIRHEIHVNRYRDHFRKLDAAETES